MPIAQCDATRQFIPTASGGNGATMQYWYVGYDPSLEVRVFIPAISSFDDMTLLNHSVDSHRGVSGLRIPQDVRISAVD